MRDPRHSARRGWRPASALLAAAAALMTLPAQAVGPAEAADLPGVPAWLYPLQPASGPAPAPDRRRPIRLSPDSARYTQAELSDLQSAPDWYPRSHSPMPEIVVHGRAPEVYACGYCHGASGQGRPENAALAGLPAGYIAAQVADFGSGARRPAWPGAYRPTELMIQTAAHVRADEVAAAAEYFSRQALQRRVVVLERARVPRPRIVGWVYAADGSGADEPLGERMLEFAPDPARHEHRDDRLRYVAYVPAGSIARGRAIARSGRDGGPACTSCHGPDLHGVGLVPPLAGRSPTYLLRQLLAFKAGTRHGAASAPMRAVVAPLGTGPMIDAVAYAASLPP